MLALVIEFYCGAILIRLIVCERGSQLCAVRMERLAGQNIFGLCLASLVHLTFTFDFDFRLDCCTSTSALYL